MQESPALRQGSGVQGDRREPARPRLERGRRRPDPLPEASYYPDMARRAPMYSHYGRSDIFAPSISIGVCSSMD